MILSLRGLRRGHALILILGALVAFHSARAEWEDVDPKIAEPKIAEPKIENRVEPKKEDTDRIEHPRRPIPTKAVEDDSNVSASTKAGMEAEVKKRIPQRGEGKLFSWWSPENYKYSLGYEKAGSSTAVLGNDNIALGFWFPGDFGIDLFLGYTRAAGTTNESRTVTSTGTTTVSKVTTTTYSGATGANNITVGVGLKARGYQNSWFQFNYGLLVAYAAPSKREAKVGTSTETIADVASPTTRSVTEASVGTVSTETKGIVSVGPKLGTEFYLKWFPHLALGFSTGILASFGGDTTATQSTRTRTTNYVNGTEQPNTSGTDGPTTVTSTTTPGTQASTFGIGGTNFQFTGIFTIRYIW